MKHEAVEQLLLNNDGIYVDATLGYGGHARLILEKTSSKSKLYGIDKDIDAIEFNKKELSAMRRGLPLNMDVFLLLMNMLKPGIYMDLSMVFYLI